MSSNIQVSGFEASSGRRYVRVQTDNGAATLPLAAYSIANTRLAADLNAAGLPVLIKKDLESIGEQVRVLVSYQPGGVVEHPGWNGKDFALLDGKVVTGQDPAPEVLFRTDPARVRSRGTLEGWTLAPAASIMRQRLPAFALMAMFLAPLLRFMPQVGTIIFELVGPSDTGKSVVQAVVASAVGPQSYVNGLRDVQRDLPELLRISRDYPVLIDYASAALATATRPKKAELFTALDYDLARAAGNRIVLISGRQPLRDACLMPSFEDGIVTIYLPPGAAGVFGDLPEGESSYAVFGDNLLAASNRNYGVAYPAFIAKLHADLSADHQAVIDKIHRRFDRFMTRAAARFGHRIEHRVAMACAAVWVAGAFARDYGILPRRFACKNTALRVLEMQVQAETTRVPFLTRLENLIASGKLVTVTKGADPATQAFAAANALGTFTIGSKTRIVKVPVEKIGEVFTDWSRIRSTHEVRAVLKRDGKNLTTWGHLAPGMPRVRLHRLELPLAAESTLFAAIDEAIGPAAEPEAPTKGPV